LLEVALLAYGLILALALASGVSRQVRASVTPEKVRCNCALCEERCGG
jgi:hypothetical protein